MRTSSDGIPVELPIERTHPLDPAPGLSSIREEAPLCPLRYPDGQVGWLATSHEYARSLLADPRFTFRPFRPLPVASPLDSDAVPKEEPGVLSLSDPPEHTRLRRLQTGYFTVRRIEGYRPNIERVVREQLDAMENAGSPLDLVENFAFPVPSLSLCDLLGVPRADRREFERTSAILQDPEAATDDLIDAQQQLIDYAKGVIAQKRTSPTDDLLSELVATADLTDDEFAGVAIQLFTAGHETTAMMIGLSVFTLLRDRQQWERLCANPSLIESAAEELLRYLTIVQIAAFTRTAQEDVELGGVVIKAGEGVSVSLAAANRDPARFANPDQLDLARDSTGHVAFGYGRHMCLGHQLARVELQVSLLGLTQRFPDLRLAVPAEDVKLHSGEHFLYGLEELMVAW